MAQEKYPASCPWDLGPNQKLSNNSEWTLVNGKDFVKFSKNERDKNWFNLIHNDEICERVLLYQARLTYQKLLDKGYKLVS